MHKTKQIELPAPQIFEMGRLSQVADIDCLVQFAKQRGRLGMTLFYNIQYVLKDGRALLYPGEWCPFHKRVIK